MDKSNVIPPSVYDTPARCRIVGQRIEAEYKRSGMTQPVFLQALGMSPTSTPSLRSWIKGEKLPDLRTLEIMSSVCGCDMGYLLGDYDERTHKTADICKETGLTEEAADILCKKHLSAKELRENYQRRGLDINDDYEEYELLSMEEIEQQPDFGSWGYLLDRDALNALITSSEFPNLLRCINQCLHFNDADETYIEDEVANYSAIDRCRINVQWYASKIAQDILENRLKEVRGNGKKKSRRGGNDQTP